MAKIKTIKEYQAILDGATTIEIPVASDNDSQVIMEMNFNHYINVLSDILVKYSTSNDSQNFNAGQMWVITMSAYIKSVLIFVIYIHQLNKEGGIKL